MLKDAFQLKLISKIMITPTVLHMIFEREDGALLKFIPGQFITFHFDLGSEHFIRSYSIASIPTQTHAIEIAVTPYPEGAGTTKLFSMETGDTIETTGPFGRLILPEHNPKRYILIATGTGITPYRTMLPELEKRLAQQDLSITILLGIKNPEELLYGRDFREFAAKHPNVTFHEFYSRALPSGANTLQHLGYVQKGFPLLNLNPQNDLVYLCGNPGMIDEAFTMCINQGFETKQIRREKYISPRLLKHK